MDDSLKNTLKKKVKDPLNENIVKHTLNLKKE